MIHTGILNPAIASLLRRVRHTNTLVIADRGFPSWPTIETIDISLVDDVPSVLQTLNAIVPEFCVGRALMAQEFLTENDTSMQESFAEALAPLTVQHLPHTELKRKIPDCVGLIRTGDTTQYANIVLESA